MHDESKGGADMFEREVVRAFDYLESEYGFRRHMRSLLEARTVKYENGRIYVLVSYGPPAYEPSLSFGRVGIDDAPDSYSLEVGDLVLLPQCADWTWRPDPANPFVNTIQEYARLLADCGAPALSGDEESFRRMKERRDAAVKEWVRSEQEAATRAEISRAWDEGRYADVLDLYSKIAALTPVDERKLQIARRKASDVS